MLQVSDITLEKLKNNALVQELPEFYELKKVVQNNPWHNHDPVFDHTLVVLKSLQKLCQEGNKNVKSYLDHKVEAHTRRQLLFLAGVFHDIAKKETEVHEGDKIIFPDHEEKGVEKTRNILSRFAISQKEKELILKIVKHHADINWLVDPQNRDLEKQFTEFRKRFSDIFLELLLFGWADLLGSHLKENHPDEFAFRERFYKRIIGKY